MYVSAKQNKSIDVYSSVYLITILFDFLYLLTLEQPEKEKNISDVKYSMIKYIDVHYTLATKTADFNFPAEKKLLSLQGK